MVSLRFVYILKADGNYFTGSTFDPTKVLLAFRLNNKDAQFVLVCPMVNKEASRAVAFMKKRMQKKDFEYWDRQSKEQQARWLYRASGMESDMAYDLSSKYNNL